MRFYLLRSMRCSENYRFTYLQYRLLKETGQNGWVANNIIPCDSKLHANKLDKQCSKKHIYCWNKTDLCTIRKSLNSHALAICIHTIVPEVTKVTRQNNSY